jgi:hypothetical protein
VDFDVVLKEKCEDSKAPQVMGGPSSRLLEVGGGWRMSCQVKKVLQSAEWPVAYESRCRASKVKRVSQI